MQNISLKTHIKRKYFCRSTILSNVQEVLSVKRQQAVDALWSKLRSGELPLRSTVLTQAQEDHVQPAFPTAVSCGRTMRVQSPAHLDASSLFMPSDPHSIRPELSASAAASIVTVNAGPLSLIHLQIADLIFRPR